MTPRTQTFLLLVLAICGCKPVNGSESLQSAAAAIQASSDDIAGSLTKIQTLPNFTEKFNKALDVDINSHLLKAARQISGKSLVIDGVRVKIPADYAKKVQLGLTTGSGAQNNVGKILAASRIDISKLSNAELKSIISQSVKQWNHSENQLGLLGVNCKAAKGAAKGGALGMAGSGTALGLGVALSLTPFAPIGWWLTAFGAGGLAASTTTATVAGGVHYGAECGDTAEALNPGNFGKSAANNAKIGASVGNKDNNNEAPASENSSGT